MIKYKPPIILYYLGITCSLFNINLSYALKDWTIFIYMEASSDLTEAAWKNINDMLAGLKTCNKTSHETYNLIIQLHVSSIHAWRYNIKKEKITYIEKATIEYDSVNTLSKALFWCFSHYQARHYMLILWGHGYGIVPPIRHTLEPEQLMLALDNESSNSVSNDISSYICNYKCLLLSKQFRKYITAQDLAQALKFVTEKVLYGKPVDIVGFDACSMSTMEVIYEIYPYALYSIGSQEYELKDGWNYYALMQDIARAYKSPKELAQSIVYTYEDYYFQYNQNNQNTQNYTQSALVLKYVPDLKENIKNIIVLLNMSRHQRLIAQMKEELKRFSISSLYVDLHNFYTLLYTKLYDKLNQDFSVDEHIQIFIEHILAGLQLIDKIVLANCTNKKLSWASGFSLYWPLKQYEYCQKYYDRTAFARDSQWSTIVRASYAAGAAATVAT